MIEYYSKQQFEDLHFKEPLSAEEERRLLIAWQAQGDLVAREKLVTSFALYVSRLAHKFGGSFGRHDNNIGDCIGVANTALLAAIDGYALGRADAPRLTGLIYLLVRREVINFVKKQEAGQLCWTSDVSKAINELPAEERASKEGLETPFEYPDEDLLSRGAEDELLKTQLTALLSKLPEDEQTVVRAKFFEGLNYKDTGRKFNPVKSTWEVRRIWNQAAATLRWGLT